MAIDPTDAYREPDVAGLKLQVSELQRDLRHMRGRRDFYMKEVTRKHKEIAELEANFQREFDKNINLTDEISKLNDEVKKLRARKDVD